MPGIVPVPVAIALGLVGLGLLLRRPRWRCAAALLFGTGLTCLHLAAAMQARLPHALEGVDLQVQGTVVGLPRADASGTRFEFRVDAAHGDAAALTGRLLRLGWYRSGPVPAPGSRWALTLRLKRPRGGVNPGGFDAERHALDRGIAATGYVRDVATNRALAPGGGVDALRAALSDAIARAVDAPEARFVQALAVGDTRGLDDDDWTVLRATGITHLIAISGLHVGIVAGFGALLARLLYRLVPGLGLRLPLPQAAALAALAAASGYTALAGFALPTVRTLLMIAAALAAVLLRRAFSGAQSLALALIAMLLADPLAVLNAGFWLSFLGVAWLLWCLPQAWRVSPLHALLSAQGVSTLGLLPLTVWFFGQASVAGPLANLVAVPWVSFVVVPVALAGTALALFAEAWGAPLFALSAWLMQALWLLLEPLAALRGSLVYLPDASPAAFGLALLGALWLLLPRGVPGKPLALLLLLPLLWPARLQPPHGEADIVLLDVGQGLSVLVRTRQHALLYDAGPSYPAGADLGASAVVPALRGLGVARLDRMVLSHGDNDHAGGAEAVRRVFPPSRSLVQRREPQADETPCLAGMRWTWDGVAFEVLHPPPLFPYFGNDSSCVLRIETADGSVALLPGDISETIESRLRRMHPDALDADLLIVPHHGSATSSSGAFIDAVSPQLALVASGHRNRFGLPRAEVLARYRRRGIALLDTAAAGAVHVRLGGGVHVREARRIDRPRPWREE
nr:DNA internalization-related competence protein ComEC/Rec2 [Chiayiivirga flava]